MLGQIVEDRYLVEQELGAGAMGHVFRARHVKVGRSVAIKVMHADLARKPLIVERFAREARIAARLMHPNLVGVVDVGVTPGPERLPLLILELAPGRSLTEYTFEPMASARVVDIIRQLLNGLAHAHRAGLVHRDLKPDNVLLEERADGSVVPRIVDFGIAVCDASDDPIARRRLTEANTVIGTPTYMSPEQAMAKPLDARSDLFSLGVIMYELLAGMPPFSGEAMEVAYLSATTDAPSIAARAGIDVDPLLDAFARTLMARALDERFASADDALAMLDLIEHDRPAAMRALAARIPAEPVAHVRCSDEVGTQHDRDARISDEVATVRGRWTSQVTRVEHIVGARPARTRALMACGIAVATLVAIVGWSGARSHAVSSSVSAAASVDVPRIAPPVPAPTVAAVGTVSAPASSIATVEIATSTASPRATIGTVPAAASNVARVGSAQAASDLHGAPSVAASLASSRRQAATHVEVPRGADQATPTAEIAVAAPAPASSVLAPSAQTVATASAPAASKLEPTAQNVVERYVAVGRKLRGSAGGQWSRYRLIRINDALATKASRTVALAALADIERSLAP